MSQRISLCWRDVATQGLVNGNLILPESTDIHTIGIHVKRKSTGTVTRDKYNMEVINNDFDNQIHFGNLESNLLFLKHVGLPYEDKTILEIGSGNGGMLKNLYDKGYDIRGVEIDESRILKSKVLFGELPFSLSTSDVLPFKDNSIDIVLSFDVFEHISDSDRHLQEVNRVLREKGSYLLQTPNKYSNVVFETIRWKSFTEWRESHCSLHSYGQIIDRFGKNGFSAEFYDIPIVNHYFKKKVKRYLGTFGLFLLKIINLDKLPMNLRTNFYIKAVKG